MIACFHAAFARSAQWMLLGLILLLSVGCGPTALSISLVSARRDLVVTKVHADGQWGSSRVALIDVNGMIHNGTKPLLVGESESPTSLLAERLALAAYDDKVKAVILRINSPGGTVNASEIMYRQLRQFRETTGKPVIVLMMDVAASGGYYIACAGDHIIAHQSTITGSIGVIVQTVSFKPALDRWGIHAQAITSGPNKEVASPLANMTPEHREILERLVDQFYGQFTQIVRERRPMIRDEDFARLTDGRVLSGPDARAAGLVDEVGDLNSALAAAREAAGISKADVVVYHRVTQYIGSPYAQSQSSPGSTQVNLAQINFPTSGAPGLLDTNIGFYHLWLPQ